MRCNQCGKNLQGNSVFNCYLNSENYCSADCCIDDLINVGKVRIFDDGTLLYNGHNYEDKYSLMDEIGDYVSTVIRKNSRTFETAGAAMGFAEEVGGTWKRSYLPDYMRPIEIYTVEW